MKYRARFPQAEAVPERTREVEAHVDSRRAEIALDGRNAVYDAVNLSPGAWSIVGPDGRHVEATVHHEQNGSVRVHVGSSVYTFEFLDELTARALAATGRKAGRGAGDVKAAMPGRVLRVLVSPGDFVETGRALLVLEAMKMENEVRAPRSGIVRSVDVSAGQAVGSGDVLVRLADEA